MYQVPVCEHAHVHVHVVHVNIHVHAYELYITFWTKSKHFTLTCEVFLFNTEKLQNKTFFSRWKTSIDKTKCYCFGIKTSEQKQHFCKIQKRNKTFLFDLWMKLNICLF
jgi:hypothetical protein